MRRLVFPVIALVLSACASVSPKNPSFDRTWAYLEDAENKSSGPVADSIRKAKEQLAAAELACADNTKLLDEYA